MDLRQQYYLQTIGIQRWVLRQPPEFETGFEPISPVTATLHNCASLDWDTLRQQVAGCTACALHKSRKQTVFGTGNTTTDWLIIGEAPGAEEDAQGEPFVGRAGKLLNNMLKAIGLDRDQVFIANILKCRPPNNRDPQPDEVKQCSAYLSRQIELIKPKIILAVGRVAAQSLLHTDQAIGRLRGMVHQLPEYNVPLVVTYHPAYLLRKPGEKRKAWHDLLLAYHTWQGSD
jgi:DNA polymerase